MKKTLFISVLALSGMTFVACGGGSDAPANQDEPVEDSTAQSEPVETPEEPVETNAAMVDHSGWDALLQQYVSDEGNVNYEGIQQEAEAFETYLALLSANHPQESWSREEQMVFWINAYNAFTVKLINENYPLESIMSIDGGKAWDRQFINIGDKTYSLNAIEHDILRPQFKDARVHFAVNCASFSCPKIWNHAFTAENVETALEELSVGFVNDPARNTLSAESVQISSLFDWYKDDFTTDGTVIDFINKYAASPVNADATIGYMEYNWNLNK